MQHPSCKVKSSAGYMISSAGFSRFTDLHKRLVEAATFQHPNLEQVVGKGVWFEGTKLLKWDAWVASAGGEAWYTLPVWGVQFGKAQHAERSLLFEKDCTQQHEN
jgi:hypothetical protein